MSMKRWQRVGAFIIVFATILSGVFSAEVAQAAKWPKGSTIAGVSIEGLKPEEAQDRIVQEVNRWKSADTIAVRSDDEVLLIPRSAFQFKINETLQEMENRTKRRWYAFFTRPKHIQLPLDVQVEDTFDWPDDIDKEATLRTVEQIASELGNGEGTIVYNANEVERETVSAVTLEIPDSADAMLGHLIEQLNGQVIEPQQTYSFIESVLAPLNIMRSSQEVDFIATALYTAILQSNLEVIDRHSQNERPRYAQAAGIEAKVSRVENKDLKVLNRDNHSYQILTNRNDNEVTLSLQSPVIEGRYTYRLADQHEIEPRTVYRYSAELNPGESQGISSGTNGLKVEVYRDELSENDEVVNSVLISRDYYPPKPRIVVRSSLEASSDGQASFGEGDDGIYDEETGERWEESFEENPLSNLFPWLEGNEEGRDLPDDPFLALEEIEKQFRQYLEWLEVMTALIETEDFQCDQLENADMRTFCEEFKRDWQSIDSSWNETLQ